MGDAGDVGGSGQERRGAGAPHSTARSSGPTPGPLGRGKAGPGSGIPMSPLCAARVKIHGFTGQMCPEPDSVPEPISSGLWLPGGYPPFLRYFPSCPDLASLPPSRPSERRRGQGDLQLPGQPPGEAEKAAQSPHRLHRPSAGPAGAQLREAKIPERAGQDGAGGLAQPHRHAGENVVPEQKVKMNPSLLLTAPGSHPASLPGSTPKKRAGVFHLTATPSL